MAKKATDVNEAEVTREARINAAMEQRKRAEDDEIRAAAAAQVDAEIAAENEKDRIAAEAKANAEALEGASRRRSEALSRFVNALGAWMLAASCDNPASVPASVVETLRAEAGL